MKIENIWFNRAPPINEKYRCRKFRKIFRFIFLAFYYLTKLIPHSECEIMISTGSNSRTITYNGSVR